MAEKFLVARDRVGKRLVQISLDDPKHLIINLLDLRFPILTLIIGFLYHDYTHLNTYIYIWWYQLIYTHNRHRINVYKLIWSNNSLNGPSPQAPASVPPSPCRPVPGTAPRPPRAWAVLGSSNRAPQTSQVSMRASGCHGNQRISMDINRGYLFWDINGRQQEIYLGISIWGYLFWELWIDIRSSCYKDSNPTPPKNDELSDVPVIFKDGSLPKSGSFGV